jgi:hypothetical protein
VKEGNIFQRLEGLMLAARMEIMEIKKQNEQLEDEEKSLEVAAKMYRDIQAELRIRQKHTSAARFVISRNNQSSMPASEASTLQHIIGQCLILNPLSNPPMSSLSRLLSSNGIGPNI